MAEPEVEKSSYSGFERFLFFVTPIIFTIVLLVVLLALFNFPIRSSLMNFAEKIPYVNQWIPASNPVGETSASGSPEEQAAGGSSDTATETEQAAKEQEKKIKQLTEQLSAKDAELKKANAAVEQKNSEVTALQQKEEQVQQKALTDEQYAAQITSLANLYAQMQPSKAAAVIENLTLAEQVLVLHAMKPTARAAILEKMTAKAAAAASIRLKDVDTAQNLEIAALQSRLTQADTSGQKESSSFDDQQLSQTFASMTPKAAAKTVLDTAAISQANAIRILRSVDASTRSNILAAMQDTEANAKVAAELLSKLMAK